MKRIALILLAALLMLACPFAAAAFTDTEDLSPLEAAAVEKLSALGIMEGYPDGSFRPLEPVSRAELAKMLCVYVGQQQLLTSSLAFSDVPAAAWYYGWVSRAAELGWVNGYPDGSFMPRAGVTGEEAAAMLIRAADVDTALFSWPEDHVQAARDMGMLAGFNFTGAKTASRLDICLMIYNLLSAGKQTEPAAEDALADGLHIGVVKAPQERGFFLWYAEEQLPLDAAVPRPPAENTLICYTVKNGAVESWSLLLDIPNGNIYPATPLKYKAVKDGPYYW
ncbi:MAG: S-layer homology domain-containing protein, partial [Clostridiales bacterium]|nr:S-layer homology domain-containing protein [Clostridiales bacterium]